MPGLATIARLFFTSLVALVALVQVSCPDNIRMEERAAVGWAHGCPLDASAETLDEDGRLAMLIGVDRPALAGGAKLSGVETDVESMFHAALATGVNARNICVLMGADATVEAVEAAWSGFISPRARAGEEVWIYFSGYGARVADDNQDEPDPWDEAWVLHDGLLSDDTLAGWVGSLSDAAVPVALMVDAGGQAPTAEPAEGVSLRFLSAEAAPGEAALAGAGPLGEGDGSRDFALSGATRAVTAVAARRGTASEVAGEGSFTDALVGALVEGGTWGALARRVTPVVSASGTQTPGFDGDLSRAIGGARGGARAAWAVSEVSAGGVRLEGIQSPGWSEGALVRLYDGAADGETLRDPEAALASLTVDWVDGFSAGAKILEGSQSKPRVGDVAILVQPGRAAAQIPLRLRAGERPGDLNPELAEAVRGSLQASPELGSTLLLDAPGGFILGTEPVPPESGALPNLQVYGPEGGVRNTFGGDSIEELVGKALHNLGLHARQKALLHIRGEPGADFVNDQTLQLQMVPSEEQDACATGVWIQSEPNVEQLVPMCHRWQLRVRVSPDSPTALEVGGAILFNDGNIVGFPTDGRAVLLAPGEEHLFPLRLRLRSGNLSRRRGVKSVPPLGFTEHVLAFGTPEGSNVRYTELTESATRGTGSALEGLIRDTTTGTRSVSSSEATETGTWTSTHLTFRVEANTATRPEAESVEPSARTRELTLNGYSVRPFLPANENSALYRVLVNAQYLADFNNTDGIPYKQHPWDGWTGFEDDERFLTEQGIDCSRTMWFVITRSGLAYSDVNWHMGYQPTTTMKLSDGPMTQHFESCMGQPPRTGDIMVTRNAKDTAGHTVMVIDPENYVAFGSHGGDASFEYMSEEEKAQWADYAKEYKDSGVEFQYIRKSKSNPDLDQWQKWDSQRVKACWRHKQIAWEWENDASSRPGSSDIAGACRVDKSKSQCLGQVDQEYTPQAPPEIGDEEISYAVSIPEAEPSALGAPAPDAEGPADAASADAPRVAAPGVVAPVRIDPPVPADQAREPGAPGVVWSSEPEHAAPPGAAQSSRAREHGCSILNVESPPEPWGRPGKRRLALIVGVGDYKLEGISDLAGPPEDAQRIFDLLTRRDGYRFPPENICVLIDEMATHANVEAAWRKALIERSTPGDVALFFFAGHGSQTRDWDANGVDEPDGYDETLMLHDSRTDGNLDLVDDQFNTMIAELYQKTENVTVLVDACNSGSASRNVAPDVQVRQFVPLEIPPPQGYDPAVGGDYAPASMPGLVYLAAARDGTPALEKAGEGIFTTALIQALAEAGPDARWSQLTRSLPRLIASLGSDQVPTVEGDLERVIFGGVPQARPLYWKVEAVSGEQVQLRGVPTPGWTEGALLKIYDGSVSAQELASPDGGVQKLKGRVELEQVGGLVAVGRALDGAAEMTDQDIAFLDQPGHDAVSLTVRLKTRGAQALDDGEARRILDAAAAHPQFSATVRIERRGEWSIGRDPEGRFLVWGPEGRLRSAIGGSEAFPDPVDGLIHNLGLHARQKALLAMKADPGGLYVDNETLEIQIERAPDKHQKRCPKDPYAPAEPNALQEIPLCTKVQIRVTLSEETPGPLVVGGVWLANDGSIYGLPRDGIRLELRPGDSAVLPFKPTAAPPVEVLDHLLLFGTTEKIDWNLMDATATRGAGGGPLAQLIQEQVGGQARSVSADPGNWTMSYVPIRVVAPEASWSEAEQLDLGVCSTRKVKNVSECSALP